MKILNLYAGIGGNRKLWGDEHDITAVEYQEDIADVYNSLYPSDDIIVGDAHEYLLNNYKDFDFIWSSPPCQSHSDMRRCAVHRGQNEAVYPDMKLYQEIIFLQNFAPKETKYVIENVIPYYKPLIKESFEIQRHFFWSNIRSESFVELNDEKGIAHADIHGGSTVYDISVKDYEIKSTEKRQVLRNMVNPELGKHILDCATNSVMIKQGGLF